MGEPHAVVVGGGIGGLSAALALHRHGWRVAGGG
ncbi:FAD-binding protein [Micromonospora sp. NPDC005252]